MNRHMLVICVMIAAAASLVACVDSHSDGPQEPTATSQAGTQVVRSITRGPDSEQDREEPVNHEYYEAGRGFRHQVRYVDDAAHGRKYHVRGIFHARYVKQGVSDETYGAYTYTEYHFETVDTGASCKKR